MEWYDRRRTEQLLAFDKTAPALAGLLRELNALYLFGTLGFEAIMRPDGSVLVAADEHWGEPNAPSPPWRMATERERTLSIVAARDHWPEVAGLLPDRPSGVKECPECQGRGAIPIQQTSILCSSCGALGWINEPAT